MEVNFLPIASLKRASQILKRLEQQHEVGKEDPMTLKLTAWQQRALALQQTTIQNRLERSAPSCDEFVQHVEREQALGYEPTFSVQGQEGKAQRGRRFRELLQQLQAFVEDVY